MTNSCSFRITRTTEDLANTINALSQRLIQLEKRLESIERKTNENTIELPESEIKMLDGVDTLLQECRDLLEASPEKTSSDSSMENETDLEDSFAA